MPLSWSRTSPDTHYDLVAMDDGVDVGRVMKNLGGSNADTWFWACTRCQSAEGHLTPLNGEAQTKEDAIQALSEAWDRAKA